MPPFDQEAFDAFIEAHNVYGFFEKAITLKSGRLSHFYVNWRNVVEDVFLTEQLVDFVLRFVRHHNIDVDTFYGVPEGATKLGILTQFTWARNQSNYAEGSHVLAMGRAKPKEHGAAKDRYFVGTPRGKIVMIEDVTTTGGSSLAAVDQLREAGLDVSAVISLTNRMERRDDGLSVAQAYEKQGLKFYNMSTAIELLPGVYKKLKPGESIGKAVEAEFAEYGVTKLSLV